MSVEDRLERLEAHLAVRDLRAKYCYAVDERDWDGFYDLFTADPVLDFGGMGVYEGREGLERFASEFVEGRLRGSAHLLANPLVDVDVDDQVSTGRWYVNSPITFADGTGAWRLGRYDDEYRRVDGDWRIARMRLRFVYAADYDGAAWSDLRLVEDT